jgi:hypothetical protein
MPLFILPKKGYYMKVEDNRKEENHEKESNVFSDVCFFRHNVGSLWQ